MSRAPNLASINAATHEQALAVLCDVFEHSPWVAERACDARPFADIAALHAAMMQAVGAASLAEQLTLLRAHPELAGREATAGTLTADSTGEQGRLGLTRLSRAELDQMADINRRYRDKFGFPCIVALRLHASRTTVIAEMQRRIGNDRETEIATALEQIGHITRGRLATKFGEA